jgi:hypothetical protein
MKSKINNPKEQEKRIGSAIWDSADCSLSDNCPQTKPDGSDRGNCSVTSLAVKKLQDKTADKIKQRLDEFDDSFERSKISNGGWTMNGNFDIIEQKKRFQETLQLAREEELEFLEGVLIKEIDNAFYQRQKYLERFVKERIEKLQRKE